MYTNSRNRISFKWIIAATMIIGIGLGTARVAAADTFVFSVPYVFNNLNTAVTKYEVTCWVAEKLNSWGYIVDDHRWDLSDEK